MSQNALPGWLELTAASSQAAHRTELSRLKALLSAKLGGLRDELQALKDSSKAELAAAAGRAAETLQAAGALFSRQLASLASAGEEMVQQVGLGFVYSNNQQAAGDRESIYRPINSQQAAGDRESIDQSTVNRLKMIESLSTKQQSPGCV